MTMHDGYSSRSWSKSLLCHIWRGAWRAGPTFRGNWKMWKKTKHSHHHRYTSDRWVNRRWRAAWSAQLAKTDKSAAGVQYQACVQGAQTCSCHLWGISTEMALYLCDFILLVLFSSIRSHSLQLHYRQFSFSVIGYQWHVHVMCDKVANKHNLSLLRGSCSSPHCSHQQKEPSSGRRGTRSFSQEPWRQTQSWRWGPWRSGPFSWV